MTQDTHVRRMPRNLLAGAGITLVALVGMAAPRAEAATCSKVASPLGSDAFPGTIDQPYTTVEKLANSLQPGQTGCLRSGVFQGDVKISKGGSPSAPTTITSFPGERATVVGRFRVAEEANNVIVQQLDLDGRSSDNLPSPTVNGDNVVFRDNDVTNHQTTICFLLGSDEFGRARGTVIERNRIHNCGQLPPTNHHHGIYVEASDGARITDNWIYDNADRGIQLFPDAQNTYIARNVIDGNGQGIIFSKESANNVVENNIMSNPVVRYNIEEWELTGHGNMARRNCVWSPRHPGNAGIQPGIDVPVTDNLVTDPEYMSRGTKDFRLRPGSPCLTFATTLRPQSKKKGKRPIRLKTSTSVVWPGGNLRLNATVVSATARAAAPRSARLKVHRHGGWKRVGVMQLRGKRYVGTLQLGRLGRKAGRRFGTTHVARHSRILRLRAYVKGTGRSNIVRVRIGK